MTFWEGTKTLAFYFILFVALFAAFCIFGSSILRTVVFCCWYCLVCCLVWLWIAPRDYWYSIIGLFISFQFGLVHLVLVFAFCFTVLDFPFSPFVCRCLRSGALPLSNLLLLPLPGSFPVGSLSPRTHLFPLLRLPFVYLCILGLPTFYLTVHSGSVDLLLPGVCLTILPHYGSV